MKLAILAALVAAATTIPTVTPTAAEDPFGDTKIGHAEFLTICDSIDGIYDGSAETCTYEISTPFSVEREIGRSGRFWTISGTTTDIFVATWESPVRITTV